LADTASVLSASDAQSIVDRVQARLVDPDPLEIRLARHFTQQGLG
jgi:hypothetical protein